MENYCWACGKKLKRGYEFCTGCGTPVINNTVSEIMAHKFDALIDKYSEIRDKNLIENYPERKDMVIKWSRNMEANVTVKHGGNTHSYLIKHANGIRYSYNIFMDGHKVGNIERKAFSRDYNVSSTKVKGIISETGARKKRKFVASYNGIFMPLERLSGNSYHVYSQKGAIASIKIAEMLPIHRVYCTKDSSEIDVLFFYLLAKEYEEYSRRVRYKANMNSG